MSWETFRKGTRQNRRCEFVRGGAIATVSPEGEA
jgi:hypothetical protein